MLNRYKIYFSFIFLFSFLYNSAQDAEKKCHDIDNKEAVKLYEKGIDRKKYPKEERMKFLQQALDMEPGYVDANFFFIQERIRTIKYENASFKPIEPNLKKIIEVCPQYHSDPYYYLGFIYYMDENYDDAVKYLNKFVKFQDDDEKKFSKDYESMAVQSKEMIKYSKIYKSIAEMKKNPVPFDPSPVEGICTSKDEYLPIISPDNELALYTRRAPFTSKNGIVGMTTDREIEIFFYSKRGQDGKFTSGQPMPKPPFNINFNEGGATVSIDNKHLFYTICKDEKGGLNCDIYYSDFIDGQWTEVKKVEGINDPVDWDSQPSMAADGKTLFFSSGRVGGLGGIDIYKSERDVTGKWGAPVNLGPKINTSGNDKSPFMHSDSQTLYFASDGHPGFGGFDIFFTRKDEKGEWMQSKNIGYPINTEADDLGLFVSTDGHYAYFASNNSSKGKGKAIGGYDVYSFELYKEARPDAVAFIKGELKDEVGDPLKNATVEIINTKTKEKTEVVMDTLTGEYAAIVNLKKNSEVMVTVKKTEHAFNSQIVTLQDSSNTKPLKINFDVKPIRAGESYALNNIYYNTNSAELKEESRIVVEEFAKFLKENPTVKIEIHGHTDNVGPDISNVSLSTDRAFTVYDLLLQSGVSKSQLLAFKGLGETQPLAPNEMAQGRAKNRRTEFLIVEK